jgi:hypothetical protein
MVAVFTVLFVITISLIVVRVATIGLTLTGVSKDLAQFQALSAFTRSGFTTRESEEIVNHPIRRRIVMHLMLFGNAGVVIAIASVLQVFLAPPHADDWWETQWFRLLVLLGGVALLWLLARSQFVEHVMWHANLWALKRWTHLHIHDYTGLLRVAKDYAVSELRIHEGDWLAGQTLQQLRLPTEGVLVLGIERKDGSYAGTPRGDTVVEPGDCLILYGRQSTLVQLDTRRAGMVGNLEHVIAVTRQLDIQEQENGVAHES